MTEHQGVSTPFPFLIENPKTWTVLVVDDENDNLIVAETIISHVGARVITATNGQIALDQLKVVTPSIILLDLSMPVMDDREN